MRKLVFLAGLVAAVSLTAVGVALADTGADVPVGPDVAPSFVPGDTSNRCDGGQKLDGVGGDIESGIYPFTFFDANGNGFAGTIEITVTQGSGGPVFEFHTDNTSHVVSSIYVKGGPYGANLYDYGASGQHHDDGLHSGPWKWGEPNESTTKWYGLSHICVFADKK